MPLDDPRLTAYALNELAPAERAAFEAELARDAGTKAEMDEIRQCSDWLTQGLETEPCPGLDAPRRQAVLHPAMRRGTDWFGIKTVWLRYWRYGVTAGAAAACATLMWVMGAARHAAQNPPASAASESVAQTGGTSPDRLRGAGLENPAPLASRPAGPRAATVQRSAASPASNLFATKAAVVEVANSSEAPAALDAAARPGEAPRVDVGSADRLAVNGAVHPVLSSLPALPSRPEAMVPLALALPIPAFMGTPTDVPASDHLEKPSDKPRPALWVPSGVANVALRKPVTSSDLRPVSGTLDRITDGDKESNDQSFVELHRKAQWVQIDLEAEYAIYAIVVWHAHNTPQVYNSVILQVADDADFTNNVRTVFNNDYENAVGLGAGKDMRYYENYEGKLIDTQGEKARYVRAYSKGSSFSALNRYTEIEVHGLPVAPARTAR